MKSLLRNILLILIVVTMAAGEGYAATQTRKATVVSLRKTTKRPVGKTNYKDRRTSAKSKNKNNQTKSITPTDSKTAVTDTVATKKEVFAEKSTIHENILQISGGWSKTHDMYLSPLIYSGFQHSLMNEWWQPLRKTDAFWHVGRVEIAYGKQRNSAHANEAYISSNGIEYFSGEGGWGICSNLQSGFLKIMVGPYVGANFNIKYIYSSYNKPMSVDIAADLSLMFSLATSFGTENTSYRLRYLGYINVLGAEFLPDYWESYYEMQNTWSHRVHFSYIGQRINLRHELTFDMQFPHTTWRLGVRHEFTNYGSNDLRIKSENISIVLGTLFRYKIDGKVKLSL